MSNINHCYFFISRLISKEVPAIKEIYWTPIILTPIHL
nr:MAG TPA: hypothetical protein [Caudoviricetes sp.]